MPFVEIHMNAAQLEELQCRSVNLKVSALSRPIHLTPDSSFEAPMLCHARIDSYTRVNIGAFTSIAVGRLGWVSIGRYCAIADEVRIGANEHPTDRLTVCRIPHVPDMHEWPATLPEARRRFVLASPYPFHQACPTTRIGNDVWVGHGAYLKAGVTVGDGAVIGAKATVVGDVPPYAVAVGTPAKVKRLRFPEKTVEKLLALRWWQYNLYDLFGQVAIDQIDRAIDQIEELAASGKLRPFAGRKFRAVDLAKGEVKDYPMFSYVMPGYQGIQG